MGILQRDNKYIVRVRRGRVNFFGTFTNRKDAEKIHAEKLLEAERQDYDSLQQPILISFNKLADDFLEKYVKVYRKNSLGTIEGHVNKFRDFFEDLPIQQIKKFDVDSLQTKLLGDLKASTVNRTMTTLRSMFNRAMEWGYINSHPLLKFKKLPEEHAKVRWLTQEEFGGLVGLASPLLKDFIYCAVSTGLRKGNIKRLVISRDVDFQNKRIYLARVKGQKDGGKYIPMNQTAEEVLQRQTLDIPFNYEPRRAFERIARLAKLRNVKFHTLRHTFAAWQLMAGATLYEVQRLLLHQNSSSTQIYAHLSSDHLLEKAKLIDAQLTQVENQTKVTALKKVITSANKTR